MNWGVCGCRPELANIIVVTNGVFLTVRVREGDRWIKVRFHTTI